MQLRLPAAFREDKKIKNLTSAVVLKNSNEVKGTSAAAVALQTLKFALKERI